MKYTRKLLSILLTLVMLFSFAGCNSGPSEATMPYSSDEYESDSWTVDSLVEHFKSLGFYDVETDVDETFHKEEVGIKNVEIEIYPSDSWFTEYRRITKGDTYETHREIRIKATEYISSITVENNSEFAKIVKSDKDGAYDSFKKFLSKNEGEFIEFDATVIKEGKPTPSSKGIYVHFAINNGNVIVYKNGVKISDLGLESSSDGYGLGAKVHIIGVIKDEDVKFKLMTILEPKEVGSDSDSSNNDRNNTTSTPSNTTSNKNIDINSIPAYSGTAYTVINNNQPNFSASELTTKGYEKYSSLDSLGRCGAALASCGKEIMPGANEERGSISSIKPTGWIQKSYSGISGGYLWNRCHLIGWQLSAENANRQNLITGTRYMNINGMLPFENMVADYIKETGNHVAYRITPIFEGNNLVCSGVQMEAYSVEDDGDGICFNVYCYNVQPGITINYANGDSSGPSSNNNTTSSKPSTEPNNNSASSGDMVWIPNSGSKYHSHSGCSNMKNPRQVTKQEAINQGFDACKKCW